MLDKVILQSMETMNCDYECSKPFLMNFVALIHDKELIPTNREVFSKIYSLTRNDEHVCYASDRYLADDLHVSASTIQKSINKLKSLGYIKIKHQKSESGYGAQKRMIFIQDHKLIYNGNQ